MNRICALSFSLCLLTALVPLLAQPKTGKPHQKDSAASTAHSKANEVARGERVFEQNCARCHNPPQGFPPQISGSIVRHMRVRASLGATDERALLRFMNP